MLYFVCIGNSTLAARNAFIECLQRDTLNDTTNIIVYIKGLERGNFESIAELNAEIRPRIPWFLVSQYYNTYVNEILELPSLGREEVALVERLFFALPH